MVERAGGVLLDPGPFLGTDHRPAVGVDYPAAA